MTNDYVSVRRNMAAQSSQGRFRTSNSMPAAFGRQLAELQKTVTQYTNRRNQDIVQISTSSFSSEVSASTEAKLAELREAFHVEETKLTDKIKTVGKTAPEQSSASLKVSAAPKATASQRAHILVVDDDPLMLKMLKEQLREDYDVATAVSGKIAMKFLERKKTNLILLDYEMPEENGPAVLEKLRANDATKDVPVIFLTGVSEREKIQEALALKPQSYLLKPVDREKLLNAITKFVG